MHREETFEWLECEISEVNTKGFFVVDGPASTDLQQAISASDLAVPNSYKAFILQFGNAKLYKQAAGYALGVRACPTEAISKDREALLCFGHYQDRQAFFRTSLLDTGNETPVFESQSGGLRKAANGFAEWLRMRCATIRKDIGKRRWAEIVRGPRAFTREESDIVEARRTFKWRISSIDEDGDVVFEVFNGSSTVLPFFSVGIRDRDGGFSGRVWLPVSELSPGATITVKHGCYKRHLRRDRIEAFELPDPEPENREEYWEFKKR